MILILNDFPFPENQQIFASHAIGGVVGNILTALFAQASVAGFDGFTEIPGGWLDRHWIQLPKHLADSAAGLGYSFVMTVSFLSKIIQRPSIYVSPSRRQRFAFAPVTFTLRPLKSYFSNTELTCAILSQTIILWIMHFIPGLRLRVPEEAEIIGIDESDMGEYAYDYVGLETELKPSAYGRSTAYDMGQPDGMKERTSV